jgi:hypothetical protein
MTLLKLILAGIALVLAVMLGFWIIGFVYSALWYLFWLGVLALGGYVGYKVLKKGNILEIEGHDAISQIELDNAKMVKNLEEYKRKYSK